MTHAINSDTSLLSIDITRRHAQMRKNPRREKEWERNEERHRKEKIKKLNK